MWCVIQLEETVKTLLAIKREGNKEWNDQMSDLGREAIDNWDWMWWRICTIRRICNANNEVSSCLNLSKELGLGVRYWINWPKRYGRVPDTG